MQLRPRLRVLQWCVDGSDKPSVIDLAHWNRQRRSMERRRKLGDEVRKRPQVARLLQNTNHAFVCSDWAQLREEPPEDRMQDRVWHLRNFYSIQAEDQTC